MGLNWLPCFLDEIGQRARPAYLIIYTKNKKALERRFKPYLDMMRAGGIDTDVPFDNGYSVYFLKPEGRQNK